MTSRKPVVKKVSVKKPPVKKNTSPEWFLDNLSHRPELLDGLTNKALVELNAVAQHSTTIDPTLRRELHRRASQVEGIS